jgi:hypothetical protein
VDGKRPEAYRQPSKGSRGGMDIPCEHAQKEAMAVLFAQGGDMNHVVIYNKRYTYCLLALQPGGFLFKVFKADLSLS